LKNQTVKNYKVYSTWVRSWASFFVAFIAMTLMWSICLLVIARFAPGAIRLFYWGAIGAVLLCGILLIFNEPIVALTMHAKRIRSREQSPRLWDTVHKVTPLIAKPTPRIYLVDTSGMNAFAFGWGLPFFSAVGATQGIIDNLTQEELEAVMAHEIGHIANRDILVSMAMTISVMIMAFTGWILLRIGPYQSGSDRPTSSKKDSGLALLAILLIGGGMYLFGRLFGYILQLFVSRQREYAADASASKIMGTSRHLVSALQKIVKNPTIGSEKVGAAVGFLCTADPNPSDMLSTHPSMSKRLAALEALET
jgi:heat shock protein HtpX